MLPVPHCNIERNQFLMNVMIGMNDKKTEIIIIFKKSKNEKNYKSVKSNEFKTREKNTTTEFGTLVIKKTQRVASTHFHLHVGADTMTLFHLRVGTQ